MEYNFVEIGQRIKAMRKKCGWSQDKFIEQLNAVYLQIGRNKLSKIENGDEYAFTLDFLLACCKLFRCDIGYLMGEYGECKTRDNQFIHEQTGLSSKAIQCIIDLHHPSDSASRFIVPTDAPDIMNWIIENINDDLLMLYLSCLCKKARAHQRSCDEDDGTYWETRNELDLAKYQVNKQLDGLFDYFIKDFCLHQVDTSPNWEVIDDGHD